MTDTITINRTDNSLLVYRQLLAVYNKFCIYSELWMIGRVLIDERPRFPCIFTGFRANIETYRLNLKKVRF